jgi:DTW domain-containing protein
MDRLSLEERRQLNRDAEARPKCARCERPQVGCYCAHLVEIPTKTKVVLLQHPREQDVAIGTARMASLCLPNAELHIVADVTEGSPLAATMADPARPAILLYPGDEAIDVTAHPPAGPVTLVVVDGTWSQTKKMVRKSPVLAALPRYAFVPPRPSEYRIRKEPTDTHVATIEALVHVLTALEGNSATERARFEALLPPFRAMIDFQIECQRKLAGARKKKPKKRVDRRVLAIPGWLRDEARLADLVCVVAEANALPYHDRPAEGGYQDELVQWAACRPATGEVFARVVRPRRSLGPNTTAYTRLDEETLLSAPTPEEVFAEWRAFVRPTDVLCSWGRYETSLFARAGGELPQNRVDLRQVARDLSGGKVGTLEGFVEGLVEAESPRAERGSPLPSACPAVADVPGRARGKLDGVLAVLGRVLAIARSA